MCIEMENALSKAMKFCFQISLISMIGCAAIHSEKVENMHIRIIVHYGNGIGISNMYVNGVWVGSHGGWGGGGSGICCIALSADRTKPVVVTVRWESCDIRHFAFRNGEMVEPDEECRREWHQRNVPVRFSEKRAGHHFGLVIHILQDHKVEAWTSDKGIFEDDYPGPKYPIDPAPDYESISGGASSSKVDWRIFSR